MVTAPKPYNSGPVAICLVEFMSILETEFSERGLAESAHKIRPWSSVVSRLWHAAGLWVFVLERSGQAYFAPAEDWVPREENSLSEFDMKSMGQWKQNPSF